ncbi:OsmC family protein [Brumicola nitratireducens]|uniref:Osmotically inducible protein C n=1 Tax=Glaciecola nitratireducens (strain JCM 12485 / KCTC 12276 / FR1064) TaxID=1085623 RepID=G4QIZ8_GLANF|nr:OsmC family protein [Glaciecola nitratireducens]AEP28337.1 osmotically inducible protein C [Glaciecola nitratireducens FR1064]
MTIKNWASAKYQGLGKEGKGSVSTQSGAFNEQPYGFNTRFDDKKGTNPEEQIAAAHASCFTMALSFGLAEKGLKSGELDTRATVSLDKDGDGFSVTKSELVLKAKVAGINEADFAAAAKDAKQNCPISKLLNCEISLTIESFESL